MAIKLRDSKSGLNKGDDFMKKGPMKKTMNKIVDKVEDVKDKIVKKMK